MDIGYVKSRMNVEDDRLSSLSNDVIHKILSSFSLREVIGMSVLSSRWRFIWTSLPYLNLYFEESYTLPHFSNFVSKVLSRRNCQTQVYSVKLILKGAICNESIKSILNYAFSYNIQHLSGHFYKVASIPTPGWNLPALTTLHLDGITLSHEYTDRCIGFISKCTNLKNIYLLRCYVKGTDALNIIHPRLSNLTLENMHRCVDVVNVVAPELKNLTIIDCYQNQLITAPGLTSLVVKGYYGPLPLLVIDGFVSLEKADLCIYHPDYREARTIISILQQLHTVKFLTLDLKILELLSSSTEVMAHKPSPFANLKILKFSTSNYPIRVYLEVLPQEKTTISTEIKKYDGSYQNSIFKMVSSKEIEVMRDIISAQEHVANLRVWLKYGNKIFRDTNNAHIERPNAPMLSCKVQVNKQLTQSASEMLSNIGERMPQFKQSKCDENKQIKIEVLLTKLKHIEGLVAKLPASKRSGIQATFDVVCEEAADVTSKMLDSMTIIRHK